jgi:hypothetical protein
MAIEEIDAPFFKEVFAKSIKQGSPSSQPQRKSVSDATVVVQDIVAGILVTCDP